MRVELPFGRIGIVAGLLLLHVVVLFSMFKIARQPVPQPTPVLVVSFISTSTKAKPRRPRMVQATTAELQLPVPTAPAIETAPPLMTAPEVVAAIADPVEAQPMPIVASSTEQPPRMVESVAYVQEPVIQYPMQSRKRREQGVVLFEVLVDERGMPVKIEIERSSGYARLDEAGLEAMQQSRFRPYTENGVARSCLVLIPLRFTLKRS